MPLELKEESRRNACRETWIDPESFATTLVHLFHDQYYNPEASPAENCYTWHPGTILLEIRDDFRVELPRPNFDRLMTGIWLVTSDEFYQNVPSFIEACNVLSGSITEALLLAPPEEEDESPFSEEILAYIGQALDQEGIVHAPDILRLGTRSGDLAAKVNATFSDDPEMFSAIYKAEGEKTDEINQLVRENLTRLIQQLGRLRLNNGNAAGLAARLHDNIKI
jgi:hypothetical protein